MNSFISKTEGLNTELSNASRRMAIDFRNAIDTRLKQAIPAYKEAARQFDEFRTMVPETLLQYGNPQKEVFYGKLKNAEGKLFEKIQDVISRSKQGGSSSILDINTRKNLEQNLLKLEQTNPTAIKQMGYNSAQEAIDDLAKKSDIGALFKEVSGVEARTSMPKSIQTAALGVAETGRGIIEGVANKAGLAMGSKSMKAVAAPMQQMNKIFKASDDKLRGLAERMAQSQDKLAQNTGEKLLQALDNKGDVSRNAILFTILQNPNLRGQIQEDDVMDVPDNGR